MFQVSNGPYKVLSTVIGAATDHAIDLLNHAGWSVEVDAVVNSTAKTAADAVAATGAIQTTLTWTAVVNSAGQGSLGNAITVSLDPGGTAGAEVVTVSGNAIAVKMQAGTSTFTQVRTALNAAAPAAALATFLGTSASTPTATSTAAAHTYQTNLVCTAVVSATHPGSFGNSITVAFTPGAVAGSEVVTVVGTAISVQVATGVSTVTQVRTAMQAASACTALVTTTGTNASTISTASAIALSGGVDGATASTGGVDSKFTAGILAGTSAITISAHGYFTGQVLQATTSAGSLPTGLATSTNYYAYKVDANTLQLFDTLAHALAAVASGTTSNISASTGLVAITAEGTVGSTVTLTPTAVSACSYKLQKSNAYNPYTYNLTPTWIDCVSGETDDVVTNTITTTGASMASAINANYAYGNVHFAISAGTVQVTVYVMSKLI